MSCFKHQEVSAIGNCKFCQRALCNNCYEVVRDCLCCKDDKCQTNLDEEFQVIEKSKRIYMIGELNKKKTPITAIFHLVFGFLMMALGLFNLIIVKSDDFVIVILGGFFIASGLYCFFKKDKINC